MKLNKDLRDAFYSSNGCLLVVSVGSGIRWMSTVSGLNLQKQKS